MCVPTCLWRNFTYLDFLGRFCVWLLHISSSYFPTSQFSPQFLVIFLRLNGIETNRGKKARKYSNNAGKQGLKKTKQGRERSIKKGPGFFILKTDTAKYIDCSQGKFHWTILPNLAQILVAQKSVVKISLKNSTSATGRHRSSQYSMLSYPCSQPSTTKRCFSTYDSI